MHNDNLHKINEYLLLSSPFVLKVTPFRIATCISASKTRRNVTNLTKRKKKRSIKNNNRWFATIPVRFKRQRPWRPCWMKGTIELIIILLLMVIKHGGDDVSCKRSIHTSSLRNPNFVPKFIKYNLLSVGHV